MALGRVLIVVGLACLAASVLAQPVAESPLAEGRYLVNGSGVVYDDSSITFYLNGTALGTVPISDVTTDDHEDDGSHTVDLTHHKTPPAPAPGSPETEADVLTEIFDQLLDKPDEENPLDKIIIGRKLKL